jgi:hypothetical protein
MNDGMMMSMMTMTIDVLSTATDISDISRLDDDDWNHLAIDAVFMLVPHGLNAMPYK